MKGQELKLLFKDDMAFLTEEVALDINQVHISDIPVKFQASAFWTIRVINYIEKENRLFVEVLSYQVGETEFPQNQIELTDTLITIEKITFKSIDTAGLLRTLNSTAPVKILPPKQEIIYRRETPVQPETEIEKESIKRTLIETFSIPIKNVRFLLGGVAFDKKLPTFKKPIEFQILNENIIEEFDAIKNYFANVLNTKKIQVVATIETIDGLITEINATSVEIDKIDKTTVEEVKFEIVKVARRKESTEDKQLFTIDEYLETFADEGYNAKSIFTDDIHFFETLLEMSDTKHYKHLRFLSSKHRHDILKLRFVPKPFSFVFLLSDSGNFYIIWETLDTQEATYIWTATNDKVLLNQILTHIDKTIKLIKSEGKNDYISRNEENFCRVYHDYTDLVNGFKNWKDAIEKVVK